MSESDIDWTTAPGLAQAKLPDQIKKEVKYDMEVSHIVGYPVRSNDPRLIKLVIKWKTKTGNSAETDIADNFLNSPECLAELKKTFNEKTT